MGGTPGSIPPFQVGSLSHGDRESVQINIKEKARENEMREFGGREGKERRRERQRQTTETERAGPGSDGCFLTMPSCTLSSHHNATLQPSNKTRPSPPPPPISDLASVRDTSNQRR